MSTTTLTCADIRRTGEKKRADPDAKLLEHRGVTISELATELNGGAGTQPGREHNNTKVNISVWRFLRRRVGGSCVFVSEKSLTCWLCMVVDLASPINEADFPNQGRRVAQL